MTCRCHCRRLPGTLLALALLAGCGRPGAQPPSPSQVKDFRTLYALHCAGCHGADGKLGPAPPLNDPIFLAIVPDDVLTSVVTHGREGTLMPGFARHHGGDLTDEQIDIVVKGLRTTWQKEPFRPKKGQRPPAYQASSSVAGDAKAGAKFFGKVCADCHGEKGRGGDAGALNDPAFLALLSDQALRRFVITGRPDLGMPTYQENGVGDKEAADLVALFASWRVPSMPGPPGRPHTRSKPTK